MQKINTILNNEKYRSYMDMINASEQDRIFCRHGLDHCLDVARIAYIISMEENVGGNSRKPDRELIYAAALLHDVGRADPDGTGKEHHILSMQYAGEILAECGFEEDEIDIIRDAIGSHNTDGLSRNGLAYYLYKADKLSRNCFDCKAADQCYWVDDERNKGVTY